MTRVAVSLDRGMTPSLGGGKSGPGRVTHFLPRTSHAASEQRAPRSTGGVQVRPSSVRSDAALGWLFTALVWLAAASSAAALEPDRAMSQYIRDEWGSARGYPGGAVHAIAQSRDGYLWIAAERGLVRFDGLKFELIEVSPAATGGGTSILGVAADPDGGIWARPAGPALFAIKDGVQTDLSRATSSRPPP